MSDKKVSLRAQPRIIPGWHYYFVLLALARYYNFVLVYNPDSTTLY